MTTLEWLTFASLAAVIFPAFYAEPVFANIPGRTARGLQMLDLICSQ
jgi:hypothetical protein